jgi:hypothetical protein
MSAVSDAAAKALTHLNRGERHPIDHARLAEALSSHDDGRETLRLRFAGMSDDDWRKTLMFLGPTKPHQPGNADGNIEPR